MIWRGDKPLPAFFTTVPDAELVALGLPKMFQTQQFG